MWTVSFVNPNFQQGPREFNSWYLPYSAGVIWQYAQQDPWISENFLLGDFIWRRDAIDDAAAQLSQHDVVGFSTYVWNKNYNYRLAQRLREINPDCLIIFGGPEPPIEDPRFFQRFPFINIMVKLEGEYSFRDILLAFPDRRFGSIPGLMLNQQGEVLDTGSPRRIDDLDLIPSPYLAGTFDQLIRDNPDVEWNAVVETNRGCPYQCTFCDWGSLTYNKIKKFDLDRVLDELEWCGRNRIGFISLADANFGIFPERDSIIADKFIEVQQRYGYPKNHSINWAKNQKPEVIDIVKKMVDAGTRGGLVVSVQSLNDDVLDIIKRRNLEINKIEEIFRICDRENITAFTELILGLPGETLHSWRENYWRLLRANNHTGITYYNAQMLENAEMNLRQKSFHRIDTVTVTDYMSGTTQYDEIVEGVEVVRSTRQMPYVDMISALEFSWFINTFHIRGLTTWLSRFAQVQAGIDYRDFYDRLYVWIQRDAWWRQQIEEIRHYSDQWLTQGRVNHPLINGITVNGVNLGDRTGIVIALERKYDAIYVMLRDFYHDLLPQHDTYADDLFRVQENYLVKWEQIKDYPLQIDLDHDIVGSIQGTADLHRGASYRFGFLEDTNMTLATFCENLWYGRRRGFGKAMIQKLE
jgi:radical SAM superfamily enzyme YgiQ (UPF0313 family)